MGTTSKLQGDVTTWTGRIATFLMERYEDLEGQPL